MKKSTYLPSISSSSATPLKCSVSYINLLKKIAINVSPNSEEENTVKYLHMKVEGLLFFPKTISRMHLQFDVRNLL